jgi:hypothetical protein
MIVVRLYETLGLPAIQLEIHSECCGSGTCQKPDQREYQSTTLTCVPGITTADVYCGLVHELLSEHDEGTLSALITGHLGSTRTG